MTRSMESRQLRIPDDPTGIAEPHDVLAAEDFAMPSGPDHIVAKLREHGTRRPVLALGALLGGLLVLVRRRRR
jgi:hypothetical protein